MNLIRSLDRHRRAVGVFGFVGLAVMAGAFLGTLPSVLDDEYGVEQWVMERPEGSFEPRPLPRYTSIVGGVGALLTFPSLLLLLGRNDREEREAGKWGQPRTRKSRRIA